MIRGRQQVAALILASLIGCNEGPEFRNGGKQSQQIEEEESLDAVPTVLSETFSLYNVSQGSLAWDPSKHDQVTQTLALKNPKASTLKVSQLERALVSVTTYQGHDGDEVDESFDVWELGKLDILVVVDNSSSMDVYQGELSDRLDSILSDVSNTNWRIGFVTTESYCVRDVINRADFTADPTDAKARFAAAVTAGEDGNTVERGIEMAIKGFREHAECPTVAGIEGNAWYRESSDKVVFIISNEENCGSSDNEVDCDWLDEDGNVVESYEKWYPEHFKNFIDETGASVFGLLDDPSCGAGWSREPEQYRKIMHCSRSSDPNCWDEDPPATGDGWWPICSNNYDFILEQISSDVSNIVHQSFELNGTPESGSLSIEVDDKPLMSGFSLVDNVVSIDKGVLSDNDDEIRFMYRYNAVDRFSAVTLAADDVDWRTVQVKINSKGIDSQAFSADEQTKTVTFVDLPPDRSEVKLTYRKNTTLPNRFALGQTVIEASLDVKVAGETSDYTFDGNTSEVVFADAPMDGERITVSYVPQSRVTNQFTGLLFAEGNLSAVSAVEGTNGAEVSVVYSEGQLEFQPDDLYGHDLVVVEYWLDLQSDDYLLPLPQEAFSVSVRDANGDPIDACANLSLTEEEQWIDVSCLMHRREAASVEYSYVDGQNTKFRLPAAMQHEDVQLSVSINGEPFEAFTIQDGFLMIDVLDGYDVDAEISVRSSIDAN